MRRETIFGGFLQLQCHPYIENAFSIVSRDVMDINGHL